MNLRKRVVVVSSFTHILRPFPFINDLIGYLLDIEWIINV